MKETVFLDTNVILRLLIADIGHQFKKSKLLFNKIEEGQLVGIVSLLVINELIWVLENFYKKERLEYIPLLMELFSIKTIKILEISKTDLMSLFRTMLSLNLDFTDLYLWFLGKDSGIKIETYDKQVKKL